MRVKIVEMMGAGLPVVASPIAIEGNLAVAGDHYAPAASAAEFAASIVSLVEDSSGRNEMAVSARRFVEETYADVAIAEAWRQAIDRTIEGWQQRSGV